MTKREGEYAAALAALEVDWPERVNAALRKRLQSGDAAEFKAWKKELL